MRSAVILAFVGTGFVYGHYVPALLGHPEAVWDRMATLLVASVATLAILHAWDVGRSKTQRIMIALTAGIIAAVAVSAFLFQLPRGSDAARAQLVYASASVFLQASLTVAWLVWQYAILAAWRKINGLVRGVWPNLTPMLGAVLCAVGALHAWSVHFGVPDPRLTGPWDVPASNSKVAQVGAVELGQVEIGMLVLACLPLAIPPILWLLKRIWLLFEGEALEERGF